MNSPSFSHRFVAPLIHSALALVSISFLHAGQIDIAGPAGSGAFGSKVQRLKNGNIVVTDPEFDAPGPVEDVGAVYLYDGKTRKLISRLTGSQAGDQVGTFVMAFENGNYAVGSPSWSNGNIKEAGASTWCNGTTGINGVVSPANSLVGSSPDDNVGSYSIPLIIHGNYLVPSPNWDNGSIEDAGAVTWVDGATGIHGPVSVSNSLIGASSGDQVGIFPGTQLTNGNYVVASPYWSNGNQSTVGAVTWCNGAKGRTGIVGISNSLVGNTAGGGFTFRTTPLENGHYVVSQPNWANGGKLMAGAAIWCDGTKGRTGHIQATSALIGSKPGDQVGSEVTALKNGNYVVGSWSWRNDNPNQYGAVTFCKGTTGKTGVVTTVNSLTGLGSSEAYLSEITSLSNGNYVVSNPMWDNGAIASAGAAVWCSGVTGRTGKVSTQNSFYGTHADDRVGTEIQSLSNGNYVVASEYWRNGGVIEAGAVTWGDGAKGSNGPVSKANSLVGSQSGDMVGSGDILYLDNGHYVVGSPDWRRGGIASAGAATWCNGTTGRVGVVSIANSLVGTTAEDQVGNNLSPIANGNYVACTQDWDNGSIADVGAATWGDGKKGIKGEISPANSLVGSRRGDRVGNFSIGWNQDFTDYLVLSFDWRNGSLIGAGAVTWCDGSQGTTGLVTGANSVLGRVAEGNLTYPFFLRRDLLLVGQPDANLFSIFQKTSPPRPEIAVQQPAGANLSDDVQKSFGNVKVGKSGAPKTFTIRNTGKGDLINLAIRKGGSHPGDFIIGALGKTKLPRGTSTTFKVTFKPKAGDTRDATLRIYSNDSDENPFDLRLTGEGSAN